MNDRPTPETDAEVTSYFEKKHPPIVCYHELAKFARRLERERDEARDATEKAKAFKRVMKDENAKLRRDLDKAQRDADTFLENFGKTQERAINAERELDELDKRLIEVSQFGVVAAIEREDLRTKLDDALAFNMRASRDASLYASMLHEKLEAERALADRMGHSIERLCNMSPLIYAHAMDDLNAWKEARK